MQKDVHFYLTYLLAVKVGVEDEEAEKIAWADQYTDDLTEADLYGIQTQSAILGNWTGRSSSRYLSPFTSSRERIRSTPGSPPETASGPVNWSWRPGRQGTSCSLA